MGRVGGGEFPDVIPNGVLTLSVLRGGGNDYNQTPATLPPSLPPLNRENDYHQTPVSYNSRSHQFNNIGDIPDPTLQSDGFDPEAIDEIEDYEDAIEIAFPPPRNTLKVRTPLGITSGNSPPPTRPTNGVLTLSVLRGGGNAISIASS